MIYIIAFCVAMGVLCLLGVAMLVDRVDKLEELMIKREEETRIEEEKPLTYEQQHSEAMERIFNEWTSSIVNYNPYRKDDDV